MAMFTAHPFAHGAVKVESGAWDADTLGHEAAFIKLSVEGDLAPALYLSEAEARQLVADLHACGIMWEVLP